MLGHLAYHTARRTSRSIGRAGRRDRAQLRKAYKEWADRPPDENCPPATNRQVLQALGTIVTVVFIIPIAAGVLLGWTYIGTLVAILAWNMLVGFPYLVWWGSRDPDEER